MLKKIIISFVLALHNIRSHFFHTILYLLGIVIGVAALVAILSLIDGMEQYAQDQITTTTSLKAIRIYSDAQKRVDGVTIRKDSATFMTYAHFRELQSHLTLPAQAYMFQRQAQEVSLKGDTIKTGAYATGVAGPDTSATIITGRILKKTDLDNGLRVCVITESLARVLAKKEKPSRMLGRSVTVRDQPLKIVGIIQLKHTQAPEVFFPLTLLSREALKRNPPQCIIEAAKVEDVPVLKQQAADYLKKKFANGHDFRIATNEMRVEQAARGFRLFRIIMGLIVGISVLVGGIGVMNVLLIAVTERTSEIGVRKAVGANKRDIVLQFLSESITISLFGSFVGLIIGILGTMVIVPIVKSMTGVPFQAAYTWNTFLVISVLAVIVGVVFGTYPAVRASRLDPVEAIRRE